MPHEGAWISGRHRDETFWHNLDAARVVVIVIQKEREKWLESIGRERANLPKRHPEIFENGARIIEKKALALYDEFYKEWAAIDSPNVYHLEYVRLLGEAPLVLAELQERYGLERKTHKNGLWKIIGTNWNFPRRAYYLEGTKWATT